jgi:WD40 repeat protein
LSEDRTVKVWDHSTGRELLTLGGHAARVTRVAFGEDGLTLASACGDLKACVWQAPRKE